MGSETLISAGDAFRFSTDHFAPHERTAAYEASLASLGRVQKLVTVEGVFSAQIHAQRLGPILTSEIRTSKATSQRSGPSVGRTPQDGILIFEQLNPAGTGFSGPHMDLDRVMPGELIFFDAEGNTEVVPEDMVHVRTWMLPGQLFKQAGIPIELAERGVRLSAAHGMAAMVLNFLNELREQHSRLDNTELGANAEIAARLLATAAGVDHRDEPYLNAGRAGKLALVKRLIRKRLEDPLLSPARVAADMHMSVRKLHALFEPTGESFSKFVLNQRLAAAHSLLSNPYYSDRSITDMALSLGFNSVATFYRTYGVTFNEAPGDTRLRTRTGF